MTKYLTPDVQGTLEAKIRLLESTNRMLNWHVEHCNVLNIQIARLNHLLEMRDAVMAEKDATISTLSDLLKNTSR